MEFVAPEAVLVLFLPVSSLGGGTLPRVRVVSDLTTIFIPPTLTTSPLSAGPLVDSFSFVFSSPLDEEVEEEEDGLSQLAIAALMSN